ncbi:STAS domain-containing protein [Pseudomonas sp. B21-028]|uniref:STAS domain-containing protein n=1 Tax=Pseudomonas TaxID=286 RepID=UPI002160D7C3|nr:MULTISPECIES: STAS domain-containing protein [Pseudomonas]UVL86149.1 STAS domain-containing protein [Pseudomonas sp. B21-028]UVM70423.1 STAS domain-containing protein [Pseudomonas canavaninivorans]
MNTDAHQRIAIKGELSIYTAADWKRRLDDLSGQGGDLELDLGAVQALDTAGLQLLMMAKKEMIARGQLLRLTHHSHAVLEVFGLCDIADFFGDPILLHVEPASDYAPAQRGPLLVEAELDREIRADRLQTHHWHISWRPGLDLLRSGMDPLALICYLSTLGHTCSIVTLSDSLPPRAGMNPESCYLGFEIGFHSDADQAAIEAVFEPLREDSQVHILSPHSKTDEYRKMIQALPQESLRMGEILLMRCGIPSPAELDDSITEQPSIDLSVIDRSIMDPSPIEEGLAAQPVEDDCEAENNLISVDTTRLDQLMNLIDELLIAGAGADLAARNTGASEVVEATAVLARLVEEVRESTLALRTVQRGSTCNRFQRVVRAVARGPDKNTLACHHANEYAGDLDRAPTDFMRFQE